jgi:hypothetical protein
LFINLLVIDPVDPEIVELDDVIAHDFSQNVLGQVPELFGDDVT